MSSYSDSDSEEDPKEVFENTIRRLKYKLKQRNTDPTKRGVWDVVKILPDGTQEQLDDSDDLQVQAYRLYDNFHVPSDNIRFDKSDSESSKRKRQADEILALTLSTPINGNGAPDGPVEPTINQEEQPYKRGRFESDGGRRSRKSKKSRKSRKSKKSRKSYRKSRRYRR